MRLGDLQARLKNYNDNNRNIILEEDSNNDTSNRLRNTDGSRWVQPSSQSRRNGEDEDAKTIIFEKLSPVSSYSKN